MLKSVYRLNYSWYKGEMTYIISIMDNYTFKHDMQMSILNSYDFGYNIRYVHNAGTW